MAKKRKTTKTKTIYRTAKRRSGRRSSGMLGGSTGTLLGAGLYGAARAKVAEFVSPVTSKIPIGGSLADNIGMLGTAWAAKKFLGRKVPMITQVANAAMLVEAAQIGQEIASGQAFGGSNSSGGSYPV